MKKRTRLLVVQAAALGHDLLCRYHGREWDGAVFHPLQTVFPALTCTAQATFRTAAPPAGHGMIANGLFLRALGRTLFWEQSANLVQGERIWTRAARGRRRVAMLFWQQSLGERADIVLSPAPLHKHHGGMIQDCYAWPAGGYDRLRAAVGRPFNLMRYWGPMASAHSSRWIAEATCAMLEDPDLAPDLCLTYLPCLDYDLQRYGPEHPRSAAAVRELLDQLARVRQTAERHGYEWLVYGDYAIAGCPGGAVFPNRALREHGYLAVRHVRGMSYPDLHASRAFAVADHEIAHVYVRAPEDVDGVRRLLLGVEGIREAMDEAAQRQAGLAHPNAGELVAVAAEGRWLAYPWWREAREEPDYARHVDIHAKPGYDPGELFFGWPPGSVSRNPARVRGSHGRIGPGRETAWASTFLDRTPGTLVELAEAVGAWLETAWQGEA